jgi:type III pantothenate kinase
MNKDKHLVLDVGNTHIKYGYFEKGQLKKSGVCTDWTESQWNRFYKEYPFMSVLVGSVGAATKLLLAKLPKRCKVHILDDTFKFPFTSDYDNIYALGVDRKAGLAGALITHPNTPLLVIDTGSCITYDYIDKNAHHKGGVISPGRSMRYHAMHLFTEKLPFLKPPEKTPSIGTSTKTSMESGVETGILAEIQVQIDAFEQAYGNFTIILTGGDANFLNKKIKNTIFADEDLTLKGLYRLLMFNSLHEN